MRTSTGTTTARFAPACSNSSLMVAMRSTDVEPWVTHTRLPASCVPVGDPRLGPDEEGGHRGEVHAAERDCVPAFAGHRDGTDGEVDLLQAWEVDLLLGGDGLELDRRVVGHAEDALRDALGDVDLCPFEVARHRVAGREVLRVLVDGDDEVAPGADLLHEGVRIDRGLRVGEGRQRCVARSRVSARHGRGRGARRRAA